MTELAARLLDDWDARRADTGKPFDRAAEMVEPTLQTVGRTLLGVDLSGDTAALKACVTEGMS
jgi:cytochrome P450